MKRNGVPDNSSVLSSNTSYAIHANSNAHTFSFMVMAPPERFPSILLSPTAFDTPKLIFDFEEVSFFPSFSPSGAPLSSSRGFKISVFLAAPDGAESHSLSVFVSKEKGWFVCS